MGGYEQLVEQVRAREADLKWEDVFETDSVHMGQKSTSFKRAGVVVEVAAQETMEGTDTVRMEIR